MYSKINSEFRIDFDSKYKYVLDKYMSLNLIERTQKGYALTNQGILVSNVILADFLED